MVLYYFLSGISSKGGIERISIQKANYLVELGFSVSIVVLGTGNDIPAYPISSKINYIQIQKHPASSIKQKIREVFRLKDIIANIIKDADVVVSANCVLISWILPFIQRKVPKLL